MLLVFNTEKLKEKLDLSVVSEDVLRTLGFFTKDKKYNNAAALFDAKWPIYTRTSDSCPTQYFEEAEIKSSVVSNGCLIQGTIENSVVGRGCTIGKDCVIKNCIISSDVVVADGTHLENLIVDKHASVLHTKEIVADPENPGYVKRGDII